MQICGVYLEITIYYELGSRRESLLESLIKHGYGPPCLARGATCADSDNHSTLAAESLLRRFGLSMAAAARTPGRAGGRSGRGPFPGRPQAPAE